MTNDINCKNSEDKCYEAMNLVNELMNDPENINIVDEVNIDDDLNGTNFYIKKLKSMYPELTNQIEYLGEGTYSIVFGINPNKVIKVYKGTSFKMKYIEFDTFFESGSFREMFMNPILDHDKILKYDSIEHDPDIGFYQMGPRMNGESSDDEIINIFDVSMFYQILMDITMAIMHLHAHEIIHSDIKPTNILYQKKSDGRITFKLCDFNISQIHSAYSKSKKKVFATSTYYTDERRSIVLDIYMLGATLLRLILLRKNDDFTDVDTTLSLELLHDHMDTVINITDGRCYKILCLMMAPLEKRIYLHNLIEIINYHTSNSINVDTYDPINDLFLQINSGRIKENKEIMKIIGHNHHTKTSDKQTYVMFSDEDQKKMMQIFAQIQNISCSSMIFAYLVKIFEPLHISNNIASFFAQQICYYPEDICVDEWANKYNLPIKDINEAALKILSMKFALNYHPMVCCVCQQNPAK